MRVFVDTNVLVSAVASRGLCADFLRGLLVSHQLVVSAPLIAELKNMDHLQKSWSDPEGSRVQGFQASSEMLNAFIWFQVRPKPFVISFEICLFGKTIRKLGNAEAY